MQNTMNIAILGPQGCGKGTQAQLLSDKFDLVHIDVGLALREAAAEDTELGWKLNEIMNEKKELVSDELVGMVLEQELSEVPLEKGVVLDGAPRRADQIDEVEAIFKKYGRTLEKVVFINISEKESVLRISKRYHCVACKKGLILGKDIKEVDEVCPFCCGNIQQRVDDTPDGVRKRLAIFTGETVPVIEHYRKTKRLVEVNGEQKMEKVFEEISNKLK